MKLLITTLLVLSTFSSFAANEWIYESDANIRIKKTLSYVLNIPADHYDQFIEDYEEICEGHFSNHRTSRDEIKLAYRLLVKPRPTQEGYKSSRLICQIKFLRL